MRPHTIGFGLASHWLRKWHELCQPIIEPRKAKPKQTRNYFRYSSENRSIGKLLLSKLACPSYRTVSTSLFQKFSFPPVEPQFNEPLYNEVLGFTNDILQPDSAFEMCGTEPRYNKPIPPVPWHFVKSRFQCRCSLCDHSYKRPPSQKLVYIINKTLCMGLKVPVSGLN